MYTLFQFMSKKRKKPSCDGVGFYLFIVGAVVMGLGMLIRLKLIMLNYQCFLRFNKLLGNRFVHFIHINLSNLLVREKESTNFR